MGTGETSSEANSKPAPGTDSPSAEVSDNSEERSIHALERGAHRGLLFFRDWAVYHKGEILWAAIFAFLVGWFLAPPKPQPYTIYVVADPRTDPETMAVFRAIEQSSPTDELYLGDVPVLVKVETLREPTTDAATREANELLNRDDTLLVIGHLPSQLIQGSLPTYFQAQPPVPFLTTIASDEDLLSNCHQVGRKCFQDGWFSPLLQLSPTNEDQGEAAIRFATQHGRRHFLIVTDDDPSNETYSEDLLKAYHRAIDQFNQEHKDNGDLAGIVGRYRLNRLPDKEILKKSGIDCVLYAGELEAAHALLHGFPSPQPLVILSDSSLASRLSDNALSDFTPARFTYQTDAADYNSHTNVYGTDAYWIAKQLIGDLNKRGGDFRYWAKSLVHIHSVNDARRSLVRTMEENSISRTWYRGAPNERGDLGTAYVFDQHRRVGGIFHVWQLKQLATKPGSQMEDIDNWHPPKAIAAAQGKVALAVKKQNLP